MKHSAFGAAALIAMSLAVHAAPARAGDVSIGVGIGGVSIGVGGHRHHYKGHWRRPPRYHRRHYRRRRHYHPYVYGSYSYHLYSYGYPYAYDSSADYVGEPDYPDAKKPAEQGYCREFTREVVIDGETVQAYGRACRQEDGSWKIVGQD